jgi:hypothetical protein
MVYSFPQCHSRVDSQDGSRTSTARSVLGTMMKETLWWLSVPIWTVRFVTELPGIGGFLLLLLFELIYFHFPVWSHFTSGWPFITTVVPLSLPHKKEFHIRKSLQGRRRIVSSPLQVFHSKTKREVWIHSPGPDSELPLGGQPERNTALSAAYPISLLLQLCVSSQLLLTSRSQIVFAAYSLVILERWNKRKVELLTHVIKIEDSQS